MYRRRFDRTTNNLDLSAQRQVFCCESLEAEMLKRDLYLVTPGSFTLYNMKRKDGPNPMVERGRKSLEILIGIELSIVGFVLLLSQAIAMTHLVLYPPLLF